MQIKQLKPQLQDRQFIRVGNDSHFSRAVRAIVCRVFDEPGPFGEDAEIVYIDSDGEGIVKKIKWNGEHWVGVNIDGAYAKNRSGMDGYVMLLRRGNCS